MAGPCGKAQGYKQAGVVGGVGYGGGICQASTTLYGAAVRAGLTIVQRRNHSVPSTYVPIGQDAMVDYGSSDLKFRNDYDYPVKLVTYVSGKHCMLKFGESNQIGMIMLMYDHGVQEANQRLLIEIMLKMEKQ